MPFLILLVLFVVMPIAEISVLIKVGKSIGSWNTILFVIATAILGAYLVRQQGFATLTKLQQEANAGRMPAMQLAEGVALLFAGAVLLTPGFITDAIGFALLTPPIRRGIIAWVAKQGFAKVQTGYGGMQGSASPFSTSSASSKPSDNGQIIEGEVINAPDSRK